MNIRILREDIECKRIIYNGLQDSNAREKIKHLLILAISRYKYALKLERLSTNLKTL